MSNHREFFNAKAFLAACFEVERKRGHFEYFVQAVGADHVVFLKAERSILVRALADHNGQVKVVEMSEGRYYLSPNAEGFVAACRAVAERNPND